MTLREVRRDEGQRRRRSNGAADTLQATGNDQPQIVGREATEERRERKHGDADHEHAPFAIEIARSSTEEQQATKGQRVRRDEPFEIGLREMQRGVNRWNSDVDDRGVQHDHELCARYDGQRESEMLTFSIAVGELEGFDIRHSGVLVLDVNGDRYAMCRRTFDYPLVEKTFA